MQVVTLATLATLPQARALGRSLQRHQPDWPFELVLVAAEDVVAAVQRDKSLRVRSAAKELDVDVETLLARHAEEDLGVLLVPRLLQRYAVRTGGQVLHLPASAWVVGELDPIQTTLASHSVLLVPRMLADVPSDGLEPSPAQMERAGRIEETIMAVDGAYDPDGFLVWWGAHVEQTLGSIDRKSVV